jgi:amidase
LGHQVQEAAPQVDGEELAVAFVTMLAGQLANDIAESALLVGRKPARADFELSNWVIGMIGRAISGADYVKALRTLQHAARRTGPFFEQYDVLLTPTLAQPPVPVGSLQPTPAEQRMLRTVSALHAGKLITALNMIKPVALKTFAFMPYTPLFNVTGQPAMSVPLHWTAQDLPIGMHFVGRFGDEATLFRLAGQLEQARPWSDHAPTLLG